MSGLEADGERLLRVLCRLAGCFDRSIDLHQRQARVVEKGLAGNGQRDAMDAARQKLGADLVLKITNLPAKRRLGSVKPPRRGGRQAPLFDRGHKIAKVPQLHRHSMPERYGMQPTKSFAGAPCAPRYLLDQAFVSKAIPYQPVTRRSAMNTQVVLITGALTGIG